MIRTSLSVLLVLVTMRDADAAGFQAKTMRDTLPTREVERGLVNGKGWLEFGLGTDWKSASGYWDEEGNAQDFANAEWLYTTQRVDIRYGIARRGEMFWRVKTHYVHLTNDHLGTDIDTFQVGDPNFGYRWEAYRSMAPTTSVILQADYKPSLANDNPGNNSGTPNAFTDFVLTTGTPDLTLSARAKRQVGPTAITAGAGYVHRFGGAVGYLVETDNNAFNARIKPGAMVVLDADLLLQAGPVALHGTVLFQQHQETRIGTSSGGLFPSRNLEPLPDSDGWSLDLAPGAIINVTRGFDLDLQASIPLRGEDRLFFPIEDLSPTYGPTFSGAATFRY